MKKTKTNRVAWIVWTALLLVPFAFTILLRVWFGASLPTIMFIAMLILLFGSIITVSEKRDPATHAFSQGFIYFCFGVSRGSSLRMEEALSYLPQCATFEARRL